MSIDRLNLREIIEMALQIERSGAAFYGRLKELASSAPVRELFAGLEAAEHRHVRDFASVLEAATRRHGGRELAASEEELLYLRAFAYRRIFKTPEDAAAKAEVLGDPVAAIDTALDFELMSVSFYRDLARLVEDPGDRGSVEELERQEREHAARLCRVREGIAPARG